MQLAPANTVALHVLLTIPNLLGSFPENPQLLVLRWSGALP
jgi:hypothetical protein